MYWLVDECGHGGVKSLPFNISECLTLVEGMTVHEVVFARSVEQVYPRQMLFVGLPDISREERDVHSREMIIFAVFARYGVS